MAPRGLDRSGRGRLVTHHIREAPDGVSLYGLHLALDRREWYRKVGRELRNLGPDHAAERQHDAQRQQDGNQDGRHTAEPSAAQQAYQRR